jgi:hypothetical protein
LEQLLLTTLHRVDLVQNLLFEKLPVLERRLAKQALDIQQLSQRVERSEKYNQTVMLRLQTTPRDSLRSSIDSQGPPFSQTSSEKVLNTVDKMMFESDSTFSKPKPIF